MSQWLKEGISMGPMVKSNILVISMLLAGCSGPIATRVNSVTNAAAATEAQLYHFVDTQDQNNALYQEAKGLVKLALAERGLKEESKSSLIATLTLSSRPASVALSSGQADKKKIIANSKSQQLFQNCDDQEHRLGILLLDGKSGDTVYQGSAAEYHCKAGLSESLPFLIKGALKDWGKEGGTSKRYRFGRE